MPSLKLLLGLQAEHRVEAGETSAVIGFFVRLNLRNYHRYGTSLAAAAKLAASGDVSLLSWTVT